MKSPRNKVMSAVSVLVLMTGFLLLSWDAEAANTPDTKQFFNGCSVIPAVRMQHRDLIRGTCLGHSFAIKPNMDRMCDAVHIVDNGISRWLVSDCIFDGKHALFISFDQETGRLNNVQYMRVAQETKPIVSAEGNMVRKMPTSGPYKGCTISHPSDNPYKRVITGSCAGHVFKYPEFLVSSSEVNFCRFQDIENQIMWIGDCIIDGERRPGTTEIKYDLMMIEATQAATEARMKLLAEASTTYAALVTSAQARSKVDPVFLGIVLGEQWDRQSVNKCSGDGPRTNTIPFCSYGDKDGLTSHAGVSWTDCVAIDREAFDITWLGIPGGELLTKRSDCRVYVSVLSDGTVGKISMVTSSRFGDIAKIKTDLIKKYGSQYDTKRYISEHDQTMRRLRGDLYPQQFPEETVHLWTLPGLWVSYREQVYAYFGIETGVLEIHTGAPASVTVEKSKPRF